jgi:hypothetical protein
MHSRSRARKRLACRGYRPSSNRRAKGANRNRVSKGRPESKKLEGGEDLPRKACRFLLGKTLCKVVCVFGLVVGEV